MSCHHGAEEEEEKPQNAKRSKTGPSEAGGVWSRRNGLGRRP